MGPTMCQAPPNLVQDSHITVKTNLFLVFLRLSFGVSNELIYEPPIKFLRGVAHNFVCGDRVPCGGDCQNIGEGTYLI